MVEKTGKIIWVMLIAFILQGTAGCGGDSALSEIRDQNKTNAGKLRTCYCVFQSLNGDIGPKNSEELFEFMRTNKQVARRAKKAGINLDTLEDLLISERDNEPFRVKWGIDGTDVVPIVFEETGVDGKRLIAGAKVEEVEAEEYDRIWKSNARKAARALENDPGVDEEDYDE